jgi:hypothetical protein
VWGLLSYPTSIILPPVVIAALLWWLRVASVLRQTRLKTSVLYFSVVYIEYVGSTLLFGAFLGYKVSTFDLNGDGFISGAESTPEFRRYSAMLTDDAGRNLAPITGVLYSFVCAVTFYGALVVADFGKKILAGGRNKE